MKAHMVTEEQKVHGGTPVLYGRPTLAGATLRLKELQNPARTLRSELDEIVREDPKLFAALALLVSRIANSVKELDDIETQGILGYISVTMQELTQQERERLGRALQRLVNRYTFKAVSDELQKRSPADKKTARSGMTAADLPELPPGLSWPTETYSKNRQDGEDIVGFLRRVWGDLLKAGFNERRFVNFIDPSAIEAIKNFKRPDREGNRRDLPEDLRLRNPTDIVNAQINDDPEAAMRSARVLQVLATRLRRAP